MKANLNQQTRKRLIERGYHPELVETYIAQIRQKRDLFGFGDFLALKKNEVLLVQVTSRSNMSSRRKKIAESPLVGVVRDANIRIELWGFYKEKNRWQVKVEDLS
jgi:hypothetical protein